MSQLNRVQTIWFVSEASVVFLGKESPFHLSWLILLIFIHRELET